MREFLMEALPVSNGFYNWRDFSEENINTIKSAIAAPIEALIQLLQIVQILVLMELMPLIEVIMPLKPMQQILEL